MIRLSALIALLSVYAAHAASVETHLFSVDIPNQLTIQDNKTSTILAAGDEVVDGTRLPFLSVQYCVLDNTSEKTKRLRRCKPCTEAALAKLTSNKAYAFQPITKTTRPDGTVMLSTSSILPNGGIALAALSCGANGQAYVSLVSNGSEKDGRSQFTTVVDSIRWK